MASRLVVVVPRWVVALDVDRRKLEWAAEFATTL